MANDRNTVAKRQREMEKKRKADEKQVRRTQRKTEAAVAAVETSGVSATLSRGECSVLRLFREFMMVPGKMLCLSKADAETYAAPLVCLIERKFLTPERFSGGYSLTTAGYVAMRANA
jgi:hypothetical protein